MRGKTHLVIGILTSIQASIFFEKPITLFNFIVCSIFSLLPDLDTSNSLISNFLVNHKTSKLIHKLFLYFINLLVLLISIKINKDLFFSSFIAFIVIIILISKIKHFSLRKLLISIVFILLAFCLYISNSSIYIICLTLIFAIFPWLKHRSFSHSVFALVLLWFFLKQLELISNIDNLSFFGTIGYASHLFLGDLFTKSGIPIFYPLSNKKISLGKFKVGSLLCNILEIICVLLLICIIIYTLKY